MKVNYQYASPSVCLAGEDKTVLGLSPDLSREEAVSFSGKLKNPLVFRDAMLMLRQIVISDMSQKKKERIEFFAWLEEEIERRMRLHEKYLPGVRESIQQDRDKLIRQMDENQINIEKLNHIKQDIQKEINDHDIWKDYHKLERDFWKFIKERDAALWWVLDPVITVHPDQVSFEAFSLDESTYGCLSVSMDEFELLEKPRLGTTNIDFSAKLAKEMERFRTYTSVELSVNPGGFAVDTGLMPEHIEKKIDLPETWIKGFNQVSSAASLGGVELELAPVDLYDICSFLRRHKAHQGPRYMKWILTPEEPVKVIFEPFGTELTLKAHYTGKKKREEKIWGRERWLVLEKIIPLAKAFKVKLLGFGMPQFITADLGSMHMTIGFSSWSSNDWVKGTAFNILGGFIGKGNYEEVYKLLKDERQLTMDTIFERLNKETKSNNQSGIGMLFKRGEGYFDTVNNSVRFRKLCNTPIPKALYETTAIEEQVKKHLDEGIQGLRLKLTGEKEFSAAYCFKMPNTKYQHWKYRGTEDYNREHDLTETKLIIDPDGQILKVACKCKSFNKGPRNISAPCAHVLALYVMASKFFKLELETDREYKMNDIMEMLL